MSDHSRKFPPSGAWTGDDGCPGWQPKPGETAASIEGTKRHALTEQWLAAKLAGTGWVWPTTIDVGGVAFDVTSDDVDACRPAVQYLEQHDVWRGIGNPGYHVWSEHKLDFGAALGRPGSDMFGTADVVIMTPWQLEIVDFKFGRKEIAPDSPQLRLYALGAGAVVYGPQYANEARQLRQLKLTVIQPTRAEPVQSWQGSIDTMIQWAAAAKTWVERRENPQLSLEQFVPSDRNCYFCGASGSCPARTQKMSEMLSGAMPTSDSIPAFDPMPTVTTAAPAPLAPVEQIQELGEQFASKDLGKLSGDDIARFLDVWGQLRALGKDMEAEAKRRLLAGEGIPGWKMIAGKRSRAWTVSDEELDSLLRDRWKLPKFDRVDKDGSLKQSGVYEEKLRSVAQMEKLVVPSLSKPRQKAFADLWTYKPGTPVLAPEDDPAPAVNPQTEWLTAEEEDEGSVDPNNAKVDGETPAELPDFLQ